MLKCLDNAIAAGDEEEELAEEAAHLHLEEGDEVCALVTGGSSHSSGKEDPLAPQGSSPLHSTLTKHRSSRSSVGRHRQSSETVVSSSDMEGSDTWEKESGLGGDTPVKSPKDKIKSPKKI